MIFFYKTDEKKLSTWLPYSLQDLHVANLYTKTKRNRIMEWKQDKILTNSCTVGVPALLRNATTLQRFDVHSYCMYDFR